MGRPKLKDDKKKVSLSISLSKNAYELAGQTSNQSHFIQVSIECAQAMALIIKELREKRLTLEAAMEEIEDINDIWEAEFDEEVEYSPKLSKV